jgi:hypothetical protein
VVVLDDVSVGRTRAVAPNDDPSTTTLMTTTNNGVPHTPGLDTSEGCVVALVGVVRPDSLKDEALRRRVSVEGSSRAVVTLAVSDDPTIGDAIGEWTRE